MKLKFPFMAAIICAMTMSLPLMSCGDDDEDEPNVPVGPSASAGLLSIAGHGQTLFAFSYDASGRMTKLSAPAYQTTIEISYKPLKLTIVDEDGTMTMTDISTNSKGYITKASFKENGEGTPTTMSYDSDGHLTSITSDGEVSHFSWTNGNLMKVSDADGYVTTFGYSSLANTAGVFSPLWGGIMGMPWMTNLFSTAPADFPSSINSDGDIALFSYTLNTDGTINTEQFTYDGVTATFNYYYTGDRAIEDGGAEALPSVFKHNIFRHRH